MQNTLIDSYSNERIALVSSETLFSVIKWVPPSIVKSLETNRYGKIRSAVFESIQMIAGRKTIISRPNHGEYKHL